jgi:arginine decarboxylase-like protein
MTPAASPRVSEGPQKHTIAFWSKHIYFEHKHIKNHRYQNIDIKNINPKIWNIDETFPISPISSLLRS